MSERWCCLSEVDLDGIIRIDDEQSGTHLPIVFPYLLALLMVFFDCPGIEGFIAKTKILELFTAGGTKADDVPEGLLIRIRIILHAVLPFNDLTAPIRDLGRADKDTNIQMFHCSSYTPHDPAITF